MSEKYQIINNKKLDDVVKKIRNENEKFDETYNQVKLNYNERITFVFKNVDCDCTNNLVLSQTKTGLPYANKDYSFDSELQSEIKKNYDETIEANKEQANESGLIKFMKIKPTTFNKTKDINYFLINTEMILLKKNKTIIVDIFTIPVENYFYQLEFSTDKNNYETIQPLVQKMINSLKINR